MGYLYISYSPKDGGYVHNLQEALKKRGFDIWIDDRTGYGAHSSKTIQERLDTCTAFIVVVSENSFESEWVQYEIAHAKRKGIPFFPILLGGDPWLSVEATLYVNLSDGSLPPEKFYQRLAAVAAQSQKEPPGLSKDASASVSTQSSKGIGGEQIKPKRSRASKVITGIFVTLAVLAVGICSLAIRAFTSTSRYPAYYRPTQVLYVFHNLPSTTIPRATQIAATRTVAAALTEAQLAQSGRTNTPTPTKTPTPSITPITTLTPFGAMLFLDKGYLCKRAPNVESPTVVTLGFGIRLPILARAANPAGWWLVEIKLSLSKIDICWVEGGIVEGNTGSIPAITP